MAETEYERYKYDQARAYLEHVRSLSCRTQALRAEVEAQRELADGVRAMRYGEGGGERGGRPDGGHGGAAAGARRMLLR